MFSDYSIVTKVTPSHERGKKKKTYDWFVMGLTASVEHASSSSSWCVTQLHSAAFDQLCGMALILSVSCLQASTKGQGVSCDKRPLIRLMPLQAQSGAASPAAHHPVRCRYRGTKLSRGNEWDVRGGRRAEGACHYVFFWKPHIRGLRAQQIRHTVAGTRAINDPWMLGFLKTQEMKVVFEVTHGLQRAVRLKALYCEQMF